MSGGKIAAGGGGLGILGLLLALLFGGLPGGGGSGYDVDTGFGSFPQAPAAQEPAPRLSCPQGAETNTACFVTGVVNDVQRTWALGSSPLRASATSRRGSSCSRRRPRRAAVPRRRPQGRSTAPPTARSTWTSGSSPSSGPASARPATSRRHTWSPTSSATTSRR